ncbi:MFS transporter [Allonocardiopsis opalescens]|uniref:MFS-type transporter involved in bile tolerance (Atg22 family) n=1 Tax=Allonocardiopsis opalescens TaxID=1144618 RepID=A0A2T0PYC9_9ACTN|nr:MFS transporter [Allonocardiopsis opalescens]PRX96533.1 MFS-type transporter involved in bile tolerance (Atg22 family) [Allonocardiopsis opalescens]
MTRTSLGPAFQRLWLASGLSNTADGVIAVGVPILAVGLTRSPLLVSLLTTALTTPWLILTLHAGVLADRYDRRLIVLLAGCCRAVALGAAAVAAAAGLLSLPLLYAVVIVIGCAQVFGDTTTQSLVPMTVAKERLGAANGRLFAVQTIGDAFLGAPIGGVLVGVAAAAVFGLPGVLYAVAVVLLLAMPGRYRAPAAPARPMRADIAEGLRYLGRHRVLRALAVYAGAWNFATTAYMAVLVLWVVGPESAVGLSPAGFGLLGVALAAGAVAGSLAAERFAGLVGETRLLLTANVTGALIMVVPVLAPTPWALFPAAAAVGATQMGANVIVVSLRQRLIPDPLLGRVNASYRLIGEGSTPLGAAAGGAVAALAGLPVLFCLAAAGCLAAGLYAGRMVTARSVAAVELQGSD